MDFKDDIVAISTPTGMGAIALIRITGDNALIKVGKYPLTRQERELLIDAGFNLNDIENINEEIKLLEFNE